MENIYLTIAVPVYNVEKYLRRCLDSLVNQEIESFEILLVNDGSKDTGGIICDEYQKRYSFVRVIHQENRGLAMVRNVCIQNARGKYISFIDSDDYVLKDTYKHLLPLIIDHNADIINYGHIDVYEDSNLMQKFHVNAVKEEILSFSAEEAIDEMLLPMHIDVITCNKIIKVSLYDGIEYPEGKLYEDMFTNYKILAKADKIISTNYKYYVYCHRPSSIGNMKFNPKTMDLAKAAKEVYDFGNDFCKSKRNLDVGYLYWLVVVANMMIKSGTVDEAYMNGVRKYARKILPAIVKNKCINCMRKIQFILFGVSKSIYKIIYMKYIEKYR